ncbi:MAG: hypothetical protein H6Q43_3876 [Deltaproteobacteria bacterium]|jgi:hypothetical protein|nr:hypothetical protein [Deltaproteobacteria bacterium]
MEPANPNEIIVIHTLLRRIPDVRSKSECLRKIFPLYGGIPQTIS